MKLFRVLNKVEKKPIKRFHLFLKSPLYNQREDVLLLFSAWLAEQKRSHPPEVYWQKIYPDRIFSVQKWNLLVSRLYKLLEEFLALDEFRKNETQKKFYLVKAFRSLQQEKLFKKTIEATTKTLEQQRYRNSDYLQTQFELSFERYEYVTSLSRKEKTNLEEVSDRLDTYFLAAKLRQACYALSREIISQEQYEIQFLDEVLQYIDANPDQLKTPAIAIYYYCYQAIRSGDNEEYFIQLRTSIAEFQEYFPPAEIRDIYTVAINYSIRKLNTGSPLFVREAYELYLLSLAQGYLLDEGIMLEITYSNIVTLATKLKKYEWAKQFINDYQQYLKPAVQEPLYRFSLGKIFYEQGQLEQSLKQLIQVETKASFLFLGARILQLKIYYELDEFNLLESLLESLRVYLQRSKTLAYRKQHYINILVFTKQLLQFPAMDKKERAQLRNRIESAEIFAEKDWFLQQLEKY